jgi:hypothetical protein
VLQTLIPCYFLVLFRTVPYCLPYCSIHAQGAGAGGSSLRDFSELSPHVRLFQKPLLAMKAMHEMGVKLDAPTALSDPRTGLRAVTQVLSALLCFVYLC